MSVAPMEAAPNMAVAPTQRGSSRSLLGATVAFGSLPGASASSPASNASSFPAGVSPANAPIPDAPISGVILAKVGIVGSAPFAARNRMYGASAVIDAMKNGVAPANGTRYAPN